MNRPPDLSHLLEQARNMQEKLAKLQQTAAQQVVEGTAGGGMVVAVANGQQQLLRVTIEPTVIDPSEREMLQDLIVAAVNQALSKARDLMAEHLSQAAGGLQLPEIL